MKRKACILLLFLCIKGLFAVPCGDVNSDSKVDILDALSIAQKFVGFEVRNFNNNRADVNNDNSVDIVDALLIAQFYVGIKDNLICPDFPVETPEPEKELLAFPGAEGFGKYTVGGRGGYVYIVSNLNDSGPGSFREAVDSPGPRTIVFSVSGNVKLESKIHITSNTTIAGQTAPGDGICFTNRTVNFNGSQVILRYFRCRLGDNSGEGENDALHGSGNNSHIILDHLSTSWSVDEVLSVYSCEYLTIQWCLMSEGLNNSTHTEGEHGYGGLWGGLKNTHHHNLFAHHIARFPRFKGNSDFRNNVIYNWKNNSSYGGGPDNGTEFNMVANYYKPGPATPDGPLQYRIVNPYGGEWYITDNFVYGNPGVTADNWDGGVQNSRGTRVDTPFDFIPINQQSAEDAFESVLQQVGCNFPERDSLDSRIVEEVRTGTARYGTNGIIDSQSEVGGWPALKSAAAPVDLDQDGMADSWERANGLDPNNPGDRNKKDSSGYTMLENYINSLLK